MQLFMPAPLRDDELCLFENGKMLRHRLPRHVEAFAQLAQGLFIPGMDAVQQLPPDRIGQNAEHRNHTHAANMQLMGCLFQSCLGALASAMRARLSWIEALFGVAAFGVDPWRSTRLSSDLTWVRLDDFLEQNRNNKSSPDIRGG
jgi:hypothetical protein